MDEESIAISGLDAFQPPVNKAWREGCPLTSDTPAVSKFVEVPRVGGNRLKNLDLEEILGSEKLEYALYVSQVCGIKIHSQKDTSQEFTALALAPFVPISQLRPQC